MLSRANARDAARWGRKRLRATQYSGFYSTSYDIRKNNLAQSIPWSNNTSSCLACQTAASLKSLNLSDLSDTIVQRARQYVQGCNMTERYGKLIILCPFNPNNVIETFICYLLPSKLRQLVCSRFLLLRDYQLSYVVCLLTFMYVAYRVSLGNIRVRGYENTMLSIVSIQRCIISKIIQLVCMLFIDP